MLNATSDATQKTLPGSNKILEKDKPIHDWYRFVLSFPPHLVRAIVGEMELSRKDLILDPFAGTGTTLVEAKKLGLNSVGLEANPVCVLASNTKVCKWHLLPSKASYAHGDDIYEDLLDGAGRPPNRNTAELLMKRSIHPTVYATIKQAMPNEWRAPGFIHGVAKLALIKTAYTHSNIRFSPEPTSLKGDPFPARPRVLAGNFRINFSRMIGDSRPYYQSGDTLGESKCILGDSRRGLSRLGKRKFSAVITSPPYPTEKDYTRITRLEGCLLGVYKNKGALQRTKRAMMVSHSRNAYVGIQDFAELGLLSAAHQIAKEVEERRVQLGRTSGFERKYSSIVLNYFGGIALHLRNLRLHLKPGARLAYVVGDQSSYFGVLVPTGEVVEEIALFLGYKNIRRKSFRVRSSSTGIHELKEEIVYFEYLP